MKINLNDFVKVKLTDYGKEVYYHQYDELNEFIKSRGGRPLEPCFPKVDEEGKTKFQLWQFIEIYGKHIGMAKPNVILPLNIETIEEEKMKTNNVDKCLICNKEIQRDSIPRIEPKLNKIKLNEDGEEYPICDTCGNLLAIALRMYKGEFYRRD